MFRISVCMIVVVLMTTHQNALGVDDDEAARIKKELSAVQAERDRLLEQVDDLERRGEVNQKKIQYYTSDVKICDSDRDDYRRKVDVAANDLTNIKLELEGMNSEQQACADDKANVQLEKEDNQRSMHKTKVGISSGKDAFYKKVGAYTNDKRDDEWVELVKLYGQCWILQMTDTVLSKSSEGAKDKVNNPQLDECYTKVGELRRSVENCYNQSNVCNARQRQLKQEIKTFQDEAQSLELRAVQLSAEVNELQASREERCKCEFEGEIKKLLNRTEHKLGQIQDCKNDITDLKTMKWFMTKEIANMKEKMINNAKDRDLMLHKSKGDLKTLAKTKRDILQLTRDYNDYQRDYDKSDTELQKTLADLDKCVAGKDKSEAIRKEADARMHDLEDREAKLKKLKELLIKDKEEAYEAAEVYKQYALVCVVFIVPYFVYKSYFWGKTLYVMYKEYKEYVQESETDENDKKDKVKGKSRKVKFQ